MFFHIWQFNSMATHKLILFTKVHRIEGYCSPTHHLNEVQAFNNTSEVNKIKIFPHLFISPDKQ